MKPCHQAIITGYNIDWPTKIKRLDIVDCAIWEEHIVLVEIEVGV